MLRVYIFLYLTKSLIPSTSQMLEKPSVVTVSLADRAIGTGTLRSDGAPGTRGDPASLCATAVPSCGSLHKPRWPLQVGARADLLTRFTFRSWKGVFHV